MKRFYALTFKPFFVVTGAATAVAALDAFLPEWTVRNVQQLAFVREYGIFVQHWGIMVGLMGVFMIAAAYRPTWRAPILTYCALEKAFMVYLFLADAGAAFARPFLLPAVADALVVVYTVGWFLVGAARPEELRPAHAVP